MGPEPPGLSGHVPNSAARVPVLAVVHGAKIVLDVRGSARVRLYASQAARTRQPEFNLNTGDPTKSVRVLVTKRAPLVAAEVAA